MAAIMAISTPLNIQSLTLRKRSLILGAAPSDEPESLIVFGPPALRFPSAQFLTAALSSVSCSPENK
ncbi:uncharacterized protein PHALS_10664 [Plasmopara halstedii]|uniref:Uncharacterized protein n=1 Tax=Plasmopara halstedii TaxID=4781 RepID=A0A0N7L547_PLAHL|nr:uncharacterized protein PHALS_10664 [Plasmopara halstedii]CEG40467.1 hypothetical protein PHALS_10664 [Plasmopara halstedii]|eukprot:XP_024576836.1 hypothetical protein PHALS_10664 [Plasmopara halstedii]